MFVWKQNTMPELPDLQAFSANLNKKLAGKTLKSIVVHQAKKLNVSAEELQQQLEKQTLEKVYRDGKELYLKFSKGDILALHLMLHGKLFLFEGEHNNKYGIIDLLFSDDTGLVMTDFQKMATPTLNPEENTAPDAVDDKASFTYLKEKLGKTKSNVKNVLIDQKIIRGIGNAYADEILWDAGISPFSAGNKIPEEKIKDLVKSIRSVLGHAEKQILQANPDIINGELRDFMNIHQAKKKQSPTGATIHIKDGSRKTYYTEEQVLYS